MIGCAEDPTHSNLFDPSTPNEPPEAVELDTDLIDYISNNSITLSWTESGAEDFYKYKVYRSDQPDMTTDATLIGEYAYSFWTTIIDNDLQPNTPYYYRVYTEDKGGELTASNEFKISTAPDIYIRQQFAEDGQTGSRAYISQMDVISSIDSSFVFVAGVTRGYDLILDVIGVNKYDKRWGNRKLVVLMEGDTDGDGESDLYEIYTNSDPYDPGITPAVSSNNAQPFSPLKVLVMEKEPMLTSDVFVLFNHSDLYDPSKLLKFVRNSVSEQYILDTSWKENGIQRIGASWAMEKLTSSQFVINEYPDIVYYDLEGNEQLRFQQQPGQFPVFISLGKNESADTQYLYTTGWNGVICKYDIDGNFVDEWSDMSTPVGYTSPIGLYADNKGNIFISDYGLKTVNRFDSEGNLISRWYGVNYIYNFSFDFNEQLGRFGEASIGGDGEGNVFIIDQTPLLLSAQL